MQSISIASYTKTQYDQYDNPFPFKFDKGEHRQRHVNAHEKGAASAFQVTKTNLPRLLVPDLHGIWAFRPFVRFIRRSFTYHQGPRQRTIAHHTSYKYQVLYNIYVLR